MSASALDAQLGWLARGGVRVIGLRDLIERRGGDAGHRIVLTFDDGYESDISMALPRLQALGLTATFFIESGAVGESGRPTQGQVRRLAEAGMGIGSHTVTHRFLSDLSSAEVRRELMESRGFLEEISGVPVGFLSLPGGRLDRRTWTIARDCGYEAVCTSVPGANDPRRPGYLLRRLCIRRHTGIADFQLLVRLDPLRLAREKARYRILQVMRGALGGPRYAAVRAALLGLRGCARERA